MKTLKYVIVFISLFLLTSFSIHKTNSPFVGLWHDHTVFMYSCSLWINTDGSFIFNDRGCTAKHYSKGKWNLDKAYITLLSYKKYKKQLQALLQIPNPLSTTNTSLPGDIDSLPRYFDNIRFELANDTLYQLDKAGKRKGLRLTKQ
jgi:hypothetical protein